MKTSKITKFARACAVALLLATTSITANAALVNAGGDVTTTASQFFPVSRAGDGNTASNWVTNANVPDYFTAFGPAVLIFDLQSDQPLTGAAFNAYATDVNANRNSVSVFSLRFATDAEGTGAFGSSIAFNPTYNPAHISQSIQQDFLFGQQIDARYVEMTITDNHYTPGLPGGDRVGFSELQFIIPDPPIVYSGDTTLYNGSFEDVTNPGSAFNGAGVGNVANWFNITDGNISNDTENVGSQHATIGTAGGVPDNFPLGQGRDGLRVGHINAGGVRSLVQNIDAKFEEGKLYTLDALVGRRLDHDVLQLPATTWEISFHQRETGLKIATIDGVTVNGQGGFLFPHELQYVATADDAQYGIQVRLTDTKTDPSGGVNFDSVSLSVIPEPGTLAILGLSAMLIRRRRQA